MSRRQDGQTRFAYVTFLMRNDSYLPGALMIAYALRQQLPPGRADLVCLVTPEITPAARRALALLFDHVLDVPAIFVPHRRRQARQDLPYMFTRLNALRLGPDGDLGLHYERIVLLDADLLPMRCYAGLLDLDPPAGIINERKSHLVEQDEQGQHVIPPSVARDGTWKWHALYGPICPHGTRIPRQITDRVVTDPANLGINGSLFVLAPSRAEFDSIMAAIEQPEVRALVSEQFDWPEMQYMTKRWSGQWTSIDARYSGLGGYPSLEVLYGTHFAGLKPWSIRNKSLAYYARYPDFQYWYREYITLVSQVCPELQAINKLRLILEAARSFV